jgi:hypothetical protein
MKKLFVLLLSLPATMVLADSVYLEPQAAIGIESANFESSTNTLSSHTVTPVVYEDRLLPAGESIVISCNKEQSKLVQVGSKTYDIPVKLGTAYQIATSCKDQSAFLFWTADEYKIKSDAIVQINDKAFKVIPFEATNNPDLDGKITGITSDGNLTNVMVNKAKYFKNANFYGTINGVSYLLQSSNNDEKFTVYAANLQKIIVTNSGGQVISTVTFPSYN